MVSEDDVIKRVLIFINKLSTFLTEKKIKALNLKFKALINSLEPVIVDLQSSMRGKQFNLEQIIKSLESLKIYEWFDENEAKIEELSKYVGNELSKYVDNEELLKSFESLKIDEWFVENKSESSTPKSSTPKSSTPKSSTTRSTTRLSKSGISRDRATFGRNPPVSIMAGGSYGNADLDADDDGTGYKVYKMCMGVAIIVILLIPSSAYIFMGIKAVVLVCGAVWWCVGDYNKRNVVNKKIKKSISKLETDLKANQTLYDKLSAYGDEGTFVQLHNDFSGIQLFNRNVKKKVLEKIEGNEEWITQALQLDRGANRDTYLRDLQSLKNTQMRALTEQKQIFNGIKSGNYTTSGRADLFEDPPEQCAHIIHMYDDTYSLKDDALKNMNAYLASVSGSTAPPDHPQQRALCVYRTSPPVASPAFAAGGGRRNLYHGKKSKKIRKYKSKRESKKYKSKRVTKKNTKRVRNNNRRIKKKSTKRGLTTVYGGG